MRGKDRATRSGSSARTAAYVASGDASTTTAVTLLAPETDFPVVYHRQNRAHLRLDEPRRQRIADAVGEQLGLVVTEIAPYRLAGSAGSTPCRLQVADGPAPYLFGKLYATSHVRSDRWYKFVRLLRYGRLEDEGPFASVRRLVEHEDYMLRLFRDQGLRVPCPYGVVEVVPGQEYLLVTELVPDAQEVLDAEVDDEVIDDALGQVRRMWDAGVAHRDVKPSNILVQGRRVHLIDLAFGQLRPSPWREAIDLANMMLTLALHAGAQQVYDRAVRVFDPARDRRGLRRRRFGDHPPPAAPPARRGRVRPDRRVPLDGAVPPTDLDPALERAPRPPGRRHGRGRPGRSLPARRQPPRRPAPVSPNAVGSRWQ